MGAIGLEQVGRTNVGLTSPRDERDDVHQSFSRFATFQREIADFIQRQDITVVRPLVPVVQVFNPVIVVSQLNSRKRHELIKKAPMESEAIFSQINCRKGRRVKSNQNYLSVILELRECRFSVRNWMEISTARGSFWCL